MRAALVGAGNVGASIAQLIVLNELADVVLLDVVDGRAAGKALDLAQAGAVLRHRAAIVGSDDMAQMAGADVVVVTAGLPRTPGMSRDDLLEKNASIIRSVGAAIAEHAPGAIVIVVTNPLDVMCHVMQQATGKPHAEVIGMAGVLDAARFAAFIAMELGVNAGDISPMVLGGHGDSMVPLARYTTVGGIPLTQLLPADAVERLADRTRKGGAEIVGLLKTGSAFYAPAASVYKMLEAIALGEDRVVPASVFATGQYGISDVYVGLPAVIGPGGVKRILEIELDADETAMLRESAERVRETVARL